MLWRRHLTSCGLLRARSTIATGAAKYISITSTERLADARLAPSVGIVGDSGDNALAKTLSGLFEAKVTHR